MINHVPIGIRDLAVRRSSSISTATGSRPTVAAGRAGFAVERADMSGRNTQAHAWHWVLFDTAIGTCGLAWSNAGIRRLQLPERDRNATERRLIAGSGATRTERVPDAIAGAISLLKQHFEGDPADLGDVALDLDRTSPFHRSIYAAARTIGWGRTASYGDLARQVGSPGAARAVGQAMARNPVPIIIPCHRVLGSSGKLGGFSAYGGVVTKERLLALERVGPGSGAPRLPL